MPRTHQLPNRFSPDLPDRARDDPFGPPARPRRVQCWHCDRVYSSDEMVWRGLWLCKYVTCGGAGYLFDIHPTNKPLTPDEPDDAPAEAPASHHM
jgi:hypothetical protein